MAFHLIWGGLGAIGPFTGSSIFTKAAREAPAGEEVQGMTSQATSLMGAKTDDATPSVERFRLGTGVYSIGESTSIIRDRIRRELNKRRGLKISGQLLKRWAHGRRESTRDYAPYLRGVARIGNNTVFNFPELIELMIIAAFRVAGCKPAVIKHAYHTAYERFGPYPFARERYRTDGIGIFTATDKPIPEELSKRQVFFESILRPILEDVDYSDGLSRRFMPLGQDRSVILDADVNFGAPVEKNTGIPTAILYAMRSVGESEVAIADWYRVSVDGVRDAIEYEEALREAA